MRSATSIAKITKPRLSEVLHRARLFRLLDDSRKAALSWVSGPAGSGKTTLVASYLDAKKLPCLWYHLDEGDSDIASFFYYMGLAAKKAAPRVTNRLPLLTPEYSGIPAFTRRFFESLCSRLKPPFVNVLDNYHHIAAESRFHEMIRDALSVMPEGITVIINSRGAPPPFLALLSTYRKIRFISWDDLKFDKQETSLLLGSGVPNRMKGELLTQGHGMTEGWAAGLVLLMERLKSASLATHQIGQFKPQEFFDYFATVLFEKADKETQLFLLKTAYLSGITPKAATALTGNENAKSVLTRLCNNHFFTEQRSVGESLYQYHPLFRGRGDCPDIHCNAVEPGRPEFRQMAEARPGPSTG